MASKTINLEAVLREFVEDNQVFSPECLWQRDGLMIASTELVDWLLEETGIYFCECEDDEDV